MPLQVTTIQADAADEAAISGVCKQALQEEGRLDVFFANVSACRSCVGDNKITIPVGWHSHRPTSVRCLY